MITTAEGDVVSMNAAAENLLGLSFRQAEQRPLASLGDGLDALRVPMRRALDEQQGFGSSLSLRPDPTGDETLQLICRVSPLAPTPDTGLVVELIDASHWRQIDREQALISQRGVSRRIVLQLAHEVRNPLGGLRGAAQLLERKLDDPALLEYTRVIIGEADRLAALTASLLGPGRQTRLEPHNIHEPLEHVILLAGAELPAGVTLTRDYDPSLPEVPVDRDQLVQAFLNILRNAVQAVGDTGAIVVRTRALTNFAIGQRRHKLVASVEFEDNGPGVPADVADSIFFPLVSGRAEGTGFGLPLAQDLVSRHGGLIEFNSRPGQTVFMVRLPLSAERGEPADRRYQEDPEL